MALYLRLCSVCLGTYLAASVNMWTGIAYNSPVWEVNKPAAATASPATIAALTANATVAYDLANAPNALKQIYAQQWIEWLNSYVAR